MLLPEWEVLLQSISAPAQKAPVPRELSEERTAGVFSLLLRAHMATAEAAISQVVATVQLKVVPLGCDCWTYCRPHGGTTSSGIC